MANDKQTTMSTDMSDEPSLTYGVSMTLQEWEAMQQKITDANKQSRMRKAM